MKAGRKIEGNECVDLVGRGEGLLRVFWRVLREEVGG